MNGVTTVLMGIVTLAMIATALSTKSQTTSVINAAGNAFSKALGTAEQG